MGQPVSKYEAESKIEQVMERPCVRVKLVSRGAIPEFDRSFILNKSNPSISVGRASSNPTRANSANVDNCYIHSPIMSRNHASFILGDESLPLKIVDDGSTHGTYLDNMKVGRGQELIVGNGSAITFGGVVQHNNTIHQPTKFVVEYKWYGDHQKVTAGSPQGRPVVIECPSLPSESDSDDIHEDSSNQGSMSSPVMAIGSPAYIDLTSEADSTSIRHASAVAGEPNIFDQENVIAEVGFRDSEGPEELSIIKETNLDANHRSYRLDYPDSDLEEEEEENTSQSGFLNEEMSSPREVDDLAIPATPVQDCVQNNQSHEVDAAAAEHKRLDSDLHDLYDTITGLDREFIGRAEHVTKPEQEHEPNDGQFNSDNEEMSQIDDEGSMTSSQMGDNVAYNKALWYFGVDKWTSNQDILNRFQDQSRYDFDTMVQAKKCLERIADFRQDDQLLQFLGGLESELYVPDQDDEDESEEPYEDSEEDNEMDGDDIEHEEIGMDANPMRGMANGPHRAHQSFPSQPLPVQVRHLDDAIWFGGNDAILVNSNAVQSLTQPPRCDLDQLSTAVNSSRSPANETHNCQNNSSSSKMQISSILYTLPPTQPPADTTTGTLASNHIVATVNSTSIQTATEAQLSGAALPVSSAEKMPVLPFAEPVLREAVETGRKRKLEDSLEPAPEGSLGSTNFQTTPSHDQSDLHQPPKDTRRSSESQAKGTNPAVAGESIEIAENTNSTDCGPPPSKKARTNRSSSVRSSRLKSLATHCIAGAVGAIGVIAAIVATTPLQVQEDLLYQTM